MNRKVQSNRINYADQKRGVCGGGKSLKPTRSVSFFNTEGAMETIDY